MKKKSTGIPLEVNNLRKILFERSCSGFYAMAAPDFKHQMGLLIQSDSEKTARHEGFSYWFPNRKEKNKIKTT